MDPKPPESLLAREDRQLILPEMRTAIDACVTKAFEDAENSEAHEFTGERLFFRDRPRYEAVVQLLGHNLGILLIADTLKVSPNTVSAIKERESAAVDIEKTRVGKLARLASRLCVEAIIDQLSNTERRAKIPARDLAVIHGILVEKSELLLGGATARVEHVPQPGHGDYLAWLNGLRTGSGANAPGQKEAVDAEFTMVEQPAPAAGAPGADPAGKPDTDTVSGVQEPKQAAKGEDAK